MVTTKQYKCTFPGVLLWTFIVIFQKDLCQCQDILQPTNITRYEGAEYVIIPCPDHTDTPPTWNINGFYYDILSLPSEYKSSLIGLVIPRVFREMNNTSFQCQYSTGNGQNVESSSVGVLTVKSLDLLGDQREEYGSSSSDSCLYIDHEDTYFGEDIFTVAIKNISSSINCSGDITYYLASRNECGYFNPEVESWELNQLSISLNSSYQEFSDGRPAYFGVMSENHNNTVCSRGKATFKINATATTETLKVPLLRSKEHKFITTAISDLTLLFPSISNLTGDCECVLSFPNDIVCFDLNKCDCIHNNQTRFTPTMINVCRVSTTDVEYDVQWKTISISFQSLTAETNGTRFFIYYIEVCQSCSEATQQCNSHLPVSKNYVKSFEILQVLPEIPTIEVSENNNFMEEICISSPVDGIPALYYDVFIYDITGGKIYDERLENQNCTTSVGTLLLQSECAPFAISVYAFNSFGNSTNTKILSSSQGMLCECIRARVVISINIVNNNEDDLKIHVQCSYTNEKYSYRSPIMLELEVSGDNQSLPMFASCDDLISFNNTPCDEFEIYNVSVYWISTNNNRDCKVQMESNQQLQCSPVTEPDEKSSELPVAIILATTIPSLVVIIFILIIIIIITLLLFKNYKKQHRYTCTTPPPNSISADTDIQTNDSERSRLSVSYKEVQDEDDNK